MISILLIISVFSSQDSGYINQRVNDFLSYIFGIGKYIIPFLLLIWGASFFMRRIRLLPSRFGWGFFLLFFSLLGILSHNLKYTSIFDDVLIRIRGGLTGAGIFFGLFRLFGLRFLRFRFLSLCLFRFRLFRLWFFRLNIHGL